MSRGAADVAPPPAQLWHGARAIWGRALEALALDATDLGGRIADALAGWLQPSLLRQGLAAADRGNREAAFALLREAVEGRPQHRRTCLAFWEVAVWCGRAPEAADAMARVIRLEAASERRADAIAHWMALSTEAPETVVDGSSLARLLPELKARVVAARRAEERDAAREWLLNALRQCLDPRGGEVTPGLALRVFEESRPLDSEIARRAGRIVLDSPDLHATKRARVESLLASLDDAAATTGRAEPEGGPADEGVGFVPSLVVIDVSPVELTEQALLLLEIDSEQRTRVDFRAIEAIAVGEVQTEDGAPLLIDLVLQRSRRRAPRRVLRLREDRVDVTPVFPDADDVREALRGLLAELLERTHAVVLPDPDSVLGQQPPRRFDAMESYETEVLDPLRR